MTTPTASSSRAAWTLMLAAAAILALTMGARMSLGLFMQPIGASTGLSIVSISFALAIGQLVWGVVQPLFGAIADQTGSVRVVVFGGLLMAAGLALAPSFSSEFGLLICLGVMTSAGAGAGAFSILIGATAQQLPAEKRAFAAGFINAGGSFGQLLFAPIVQALIAAFGWMTAAYALAASTLLSLPLAGRLAGPAKPVAVADAGLRAQLNIALADRSYWLLHFGFFTCGVHVAFLVTHLPGEVALCGLSPSVSGTALALVGAFNIAGSLSAGWLGQRVRMKSLLCAMYASRALFIALFMMSPRNALSVYLFAAGLGFTFLATVPPTAGLVAKLYGTRYLGTLFGLTLLSHQIGGFFGAWLGGLTISRFGDYSWMWIADMVLALIAALSCLPVREARLVPARAI
ncbi:MFS transporter [uncultured Nevskia sp.]|uniref:MFS transporter n=1 Tax=uncultured Nevskia sp. TaxID=228950 RepID=UPI0025DF6F4B|nr:MFS transporter [uncultured Nevskia sp.]